MEAAQVVIAQSHFFQIAMFYLSRITFQNRQGVNDHLVTQTRAVFRKTMKPDFMPMHVARDHSIESVDVLRPIKRRPPLDANHVDHWKDWMVDRHLIHTGVLVFK